MKGTDFKDLSFSIVHHLNSPNEAVTLSGDVVHREEKIFFLELKRFVMCAPYDNHFVYANPSKKSGMWSPMCSCGSPAVIVGYNAYRQDSSRTDSGELIVCLTHAQTNRHADGSK